MSSLFPRYKIDKLNTIEVMVVLMLVLRVFMTNDVCKYSGYVLSLFIQLYILFTGRIKKKGFIIYCVLVITAFFLSLIFTIKDVEFTLIINRVVPLLAMYGIYIIGYTEGRLNIEKIIKGFCNVYLYLSILVNLDAVMWITVGRGVWEPILYLGKRIVGPMGDPNFLGMFSCVVLLLILHFNDTDRKLKLLAILTLGMNILLARSLSVFAIFIIMSISYKFLPNKNVLKTFLVLFIYFVFIFLYGTFANDIQKVGEGLLLKLYNGNSYSASVKYASLAIRFNTQYAALKTFVSDIWGQGPHQLVAMLSHDTHNSFVATMYENGVCGLIFIFSTLRNNVKNNVNIYISTFLVLFALVLNVHDTVIYTIFMLSQFIVDD